MRAQKILKKFGLNYVMKREIRNEFEKIEENITQFIIP
jgi:L-fucose isomerase-like protein